MLVKIKHVILIVSALVAVTAGAFAEERDTSNAVRPLTVDELAFDPAGHLGRVSVVGVVGIVNPGKGFVLVDSKEFNDCGLSCLTEPGTNKLPFVWAGISPKVKQTVRVDGILEKTAKGFSLNAEKITRQ